jgi:hypothetical protein
MKKNLLGLLLAIIFLSGIALHACEPEASSDDALQKTFASHASHYPLHAAAAKNDRRSAEASLDEGYSHKTRVHCSFGLGDDGELKGPLFEEILGVPENAKYVTAFELAMYFGAFDVIRLFYERGLATETTPCIQSYPDEEEGKTEDQPTLMLAIILDHAHVVEFYLTQDPTLIEKNFGGVTLLQYALILRTIECCRILLFNGADINAPCQRASGGSLLHQCAEENQAGTARLMLKHGADPTLLDADGKTPLEVAEANGNEDVAAVLQPVTADEAVS